MKLAKKYTVYLMQHSHTDIGYTRSPELTINEQVDYLHFLIAQFELIIEGKLSEYKNYKWVCESFIIVERFLNTATEAEIEKLIKLVKLGKIEITGMYANLAQVLDADVLAEMIGRAKKIEEKYDINITTAMNADINGISRDYAKQLSKNGIHDYFIAIHTHHGMYPLFKKQQPFKWNLGDGEYLNVWSGEHYMFGNGFGFSKGAISAHGFFDDVDFKRYNLSNDESWIELAESRFEEYINQLIEDDYQYDFIPLTIHGKFTDNSMPNLDIAARVDQWNQRNEAQIEVKMCTLSEFFERLHLEQDIPEYEGEWPDWWTDGVISAPGQLKLFKCAQKQYSDLKNIDNGEIDYSETKKEIDYNLTMYAEHTYGSFDSISNPYHEFTHRQWALKQNYLSNALRFIDEYEHNLLKSLGKVTALAKVANKFKIINPEAIAVKKQLQLPFDNSDADNLLGHYKIMSNTGVEYQYVTTDDWRKFPIIEIDLKANETLELNVESIVGNQINEVPYYSRTNLRGSDNVFDLAHTKRDVVIKANYIKTPLLTIEWSENGITSIEKNGINILNANQGLLNVVYEKSSVERHTLGRNRKGYDVKRYFGKVISTKVVEQNAQFTLIEQAYQIVGFDLYKLIVKVFNNQEVIEFKINCDKKLSSDIENVYLSLPFATENLILGQSDSLFEPWKDQLPGTLTDYFPCYEGIAIEEVGALSTPDVHLIQLGSLDNEPRVLFGEQQLAFESKTPYIWLMSNYWETNFVKSLAGYYEFNFTLDLTNKNNDPSENIKQASCNLIAFPITSSN